MASEFLRSHFCYLNLSDNKSSLRINLILITVDLGERFMIINSNTEKKIDELLSQMTLEEKIGQLNQIFSPLEKDEDLFEMIRQGKVGTFLMANCAHAGNVKSYIASIEFINEVQRIAVEESRLGIPILSARDVIHGHNTVLPLPLGIAASFNHELTEKCYRNIAKETYLDGVRWSFSPMIDISRDPRWGRCVEGSGEDPYLTAKMSGAVIRGFQGKQGDEGRVVSCVKHFVGYGASEGGRDYHHCEISPNSLKNYYLYPFREAVKSGVMSVMTAFNEIGGTPVGADKHLVDEVLKKEFGFDGLVISDYEAIKQLADIGIVENEKDAAEISFNAGVDIDMLANCYIDHIADLIKEGKVDISRLDEAVRSILRVKFEIGLFDKPYIESFYIDREDHAKDALALASESMVLLKNDGVLPLKSEDKVALVGPFVNERLAQMGSWALDGEPEDVVTIAEGMTSEERNISLTESNLFDDDVMNIERNDIAVICLGESQWMNGEANSATNIEIPKSQLELVKKAKLLGKKVVAVLCFGKPQGVEELALYADAILYAWHAGTQVGNAVANILYGKVNPSGKLPITFPRVTGQVPLYYNFVSSGRPVNGYYGRQVDYGNYHDCSCTPMYPFGFGLSYTEYKYGEVTIDTESIDLNELQKGKKIKIELSVSNVGNMDGKETVQLYIRDKVATVARPLKELKGYSKVELAKGETKVVSFEIGFDELAFYNAKDEYIVEKGKFEIFVGPDAYAEKSGEIDVI